MRMNWQTGLIILGIVILTLKFRMQLGNLFVKVPVLGAFIA
jgi:hypothetical protein